MNDPRDDPRFEIIVEDGLKIIWVLFELWCLYYLIFVWGW